MLRMNLITGSLAFALFAIVSLYFAWALILFGVELTHVLQKESSGATGDRRREGRAEKAIRMLLRHVSVGAARRSRTSRPTRTPRRPRRWRSWRT